MEITAYFVSIVGNFSTAGFTYLFVSTIVSGLIVISFNTEYLQDPSRNNDHGTVIFAPNTNKNFIPIEPTTLYKDH